MSNRAPAYRDPALRFDALRLVALWKGGMTEETLATENERKMLICAPANVHSAHASLCCWSTACSPHPARSAIRSIVPFSQCLKTRQERSS